MYQRGFGLGGLVHLGDWQKIQDSFSESLGIALVTIDLNGSPITTASGPGRVCGKIPQDSSLYTNSCQKCVLAKKSDKKRIDERKADFECPFGFVLHLVPLRALENRIQAYMVAGPLIPEKRKHPSEYAAVAKAAKIDEADLLDALIEINVFSYNKIRSITTLLGDIFSHMIQTEYHKKRLGEIAPEVIELDPLFANYHEDKVLSALLNTCILALGVDSGSVMIIDKNTRYLHIKAATKLDEKIVNDTHVKMGDGISGVAAATAEPIMLPKDESKNGLSGKMKRGYIKSSIIVPFNKANAPEVYGVINLNVVRKKMQFSERDIALIKELTNLAGTALLPTG